MELGREPYQLEVKEATERELAIMAEISSSKKGKKVVNVASVDANSDDIVGLECRLDVFEQFIKTWEPKLQRWDSFIEELHEAEFASDEDEAGGKDVEVVDAGTAVK
jgi:hypothetical protein